MKPLLKILFLLLSALLPTSVSALSLHNSPTNGNGHGKCSDPTMGDGICYSTAECTANGGVASASHCTFPNSGVCCIFQQMCTSYSPTLTVKNNITRVLGQVSAGAQVQPCQIEIPKQEGVCQLRLDFTSFNVGVANSEGDCTQDFVTFSGNNLPAGGLKLCGVASGQHLYLHYGSLCSINFNSNLVSQGSSYSIQITMIKCDSTEKAPDGCTQYYTAPTAQVQSFNFPNQQLNSELYTVCVKDSGAGASQTIQWSPCPSFNNTFSISGIVSQQPSSNIGRVGDQCDTDFIYVPPGNKICGTNFTSMFQTTLQPFFIVVNFNAAEVPVLSGPVAPNGCPLGLTCANPSGICGDGDTCMLPSWYFTAGLIDYGNQGFCLQYSVLA